MTATVKHCSDSRAVGVCVYIVAEFDVSDPLPDVDYCNIKVSCVNVTECSK